MAIRLRSGRIAVSRIVQDSQGRWTVQAQIDITIARNDANVQPILPPPPAPFDKIPYGLAFIQGTFDPLGPGSILIPSRFQLNTILTGVDLITVRNFIGAYFSNDYSYNRGQLINIAGMVSGDIPENMTFGNAVRRVLRYLQCSEFRADL